LATAYSKILDAALMRITDRDILVLAEDDREKIFCGYLKAAQADFVSMCKYDLTKYDDAAEEFADDLGIEEVQILALGISYHWASSKVTNAQLFRNVLNTKDYTFFAPSTLLTTLRGLRNELGREYDQKMIDYTYTHGNFGNLTPTGGA
jgi:hypothetical protein